MTEYRDAWSIALRLQEDGSELKGTSATAAGDVVKRPSSGREDADDDEGREDDAEDGEDDEGDESDENDETNEDSAPSPIASASFTRFLDFISTICPTIPQLTYPILLVVVSTIPDSILSLASPPSTTLQTFFSHLWSPVDARLLATHTLPGQPSAFQIFLQDALDITCWMIRKSTSEANNKETAEWLAVEQLGKRVWAEGVLAMGGKSARRGQPAIETEAQRFGKAAARLDTQLLTQLVEVLKQTTVDWCFPSADTHRATEAHLPRLVPIISATRGEETSETLSLGLDATVAAVSTRSIADLAEAAQSKSPVATVLSEFLVNAIVSKADIVPTAALSVSLSDESLANVRISWVCLIRLYRRSCRQICRLTSLLLCLMPSQRLSDRIARNRCDMRSGGP